MATLQPSGVKGMKGRGNGKSKGVYEGESGEGDIITTAVIEQSKEKRGRKRREVAPPEKVEEKGSAESSEEVADEDSPQTPSLRAYDPLSNSNIFWKLGCPKTALTLLMCNECRDKNIRAGKRRFTVFNAVSGERVEVTFGFCPDCAQANFDCTDAWLRLNQRKRGEDPNAWKKKKPAGGEDGKKVDH